MSISNHKHNVITFVKDNIAEGLALKVPNDENIMDYKLKEPCVLDGWIPPNGLLPIDMDSPYPFIVVGIDDGGIEPESISIDFRLSIGVYSPGTFYGSNFTPDFSGSQDLDNVIDKAIRVLNTIGRKVIPISGKINFGKYKGDPIYPYWYGYITFSVSESFTNSQNDLLD